jgi:hypothetical protein
MASCFISLAQGQLCLLFFLLFIYSIYVTFVRFNVKVLHHGFVCNCWYVHITLYGIFSFRLQYTALHVLTFYKQNNGFPEFAFYLCYLNWKVCPCYRVNCSSPSLWILTLSMFTKLPQDDKCLFVQIFLQFCMRIHSFHIADNATVMITFNILKRVNIVVYRPVAKQWLCKQRPFLGNGSVNTFPLLDNRFVIIQQFTTTVETWCFLYSPCRDVIWKGAKDSSVPPVWRRSRIPPPYPCES